MRLQVLAVLEELCRDLTLHDVREWYAESRAIVSSGGPRARRLAFGEHHGANDRDRSQRPTFRRQAKLKPAI